MTAIQQTGAHALYRFFGTDGALLYVGITNDPGRRWRDHAKRKSWWHEVAQVTVEKYGSRPGVMMAEAAAIEAEDPRYNIAGKVHLVDTSLTGEPVEDGMFAAWDHDKCGTIMTASPLYLKGEPAVLVMCPNPPPVPLTFTLKLARTLVDYADEDGAQVWLDTRVRNYQVRELLTRALHRYSLDWREFTTHQRRAMVVGLRVAVTPELFAALDALDPECSTDERPAK